MFQALALRDDRRSSAQNAGVTPNLVIPPSSLSNLAAIIEPNAGKHGASRDGPLP
jgi:hypothetical protein